MVSAAADRPISRPAKPSNQPAHRKRWAGWFDGLAGLLIGRSAAADTSGVHELRYAAALQRELGGLPMPVLVDVDIGHRPPQLMLVNGAMAEVDWSVADGGTVTQKFI